MDKTVAVVIRCMDYRESSQLAWLYTGDFGKIKVIAKGSRSSSKKFRTKLDLFDLADIIIYKHRRRELHTLTECNVRESFSQIRTDLRKLATAIYMAELLDKSTGLEIPDHRIYDLILDALKNLGRGSDPVFLKSFFEIRLMQFLGYQPRIDENDSLSQGTRAIIKRVVEAKPIDKLKISPVQLVELQNKIRLVVDSTLDKRLKSLTFLEDVFNEKRNQSHG